jgi:hypothetical protein
MIYCRTEGDVQTVNREGSGCGVFERSNLYRRAEDNESRDDRPYSRALNAVSQRCGARTSDIAFCPWFVWLSVAISYL